jgi:preprotein translocase subunit SecG
MNRLKHLLVALLTVGWHLLSSPEAQACAACFGESDGPMARGMNAGIMALLAVVTVVLGGFFAFMIFLARRASTHSEGLDQRAEEIRLQLLRERAVVNG